MSDSGYTPPSTLAGTSSDSSPTGPADEAKTTSRSNSLWSDAWRDLRRSPIFLIAIGILLVVLSWALFPDLWATKGKNECVLGEANLPPTWYPFDLPPGVEEGDLVDGHPFGTTVLGCDMYSEIIWGARPSMIVATMVTAFTALVGTTLGIISGYFGGWTDTIISRITDIFLGLPFLLGALIFLALLGSQGITSLVFVLVVLGWTQMSRIVRGSVLSLKDQDFVDAARAMGSSDKRIILRHILPNVLSPIIVLSTLYVGSFVAAEATLTFLGVGLQQPTISWGITIQEGQNLATAGFSHLLVFPCIALILTVLSFILLGDKLRDALDPKGR
jgi:peptide/nickel transport system permease protein/oligopeptide transport system permease protein